MLMEKPVLCNMHYKLWWTILQYIRRRRGEGCLGRTKYFLPILQCLVFTDPFAFHIAKWSKLWRIWIHLVLLCGFSCEPWSSIVLEFVNPGPNNSNLKERLGKYFWFYQIQTIIVQHARPLISVNECGNIDSGFGADRMKWYRALQIHYAL